MRYTEIAAATPFEGLPCINMPSIIGASPKKPILIRLNVSGKRPILYSCESLPLGLTLKDNIISGEIEKGGNYEITVCVENTLGKSTKKITLEIKEGNILVTPLLGFTSWNAFEADVTQNDIENTAKRLIDLGICEYGYNYVNTDSGWQGEYGGELDAIMPNSKFPDMKKMTDFIHSYGLKCGIYSSPMLTAWGCPKELTSIPGCTTGEPDIRFASTNGGIGTIRKERNNALQWEKWGFDYLKYDWAPTDPVNAEYMRKELMSLNRDFGFCVTVNALLPYAEYWSKYCNSYRANPDTFGNWNNLVAVYKTYFDYMKFVNKGHFFDLDMLDFGTCRLHTLWNCLNDDEKILQFSIRAFLCSPIQISSTLEKCNELELSIYCNEEILKINQDCLFYNAFPVVRVDENGSCYDIFEKKLEDNTFAYALFNIGENTENITLKADGECKIRNLWAKKDVSENGILSLTLYPHTATILKSTYKITSFSLTGIEPVWFEMENSLPYCVKKA